MTHVGLLRQMKIIMQMRQILILQLKHKNPLDQNLSTSVSLQEEKKENGCKMHEHTTKSARRGENLALFTESVEKQTKTLPRQVTLIQKGEELEKKKKKKQKLL